MFEIDFLPVGTSNGDAICVRYGNDTDGYYLHLVDGGFSDTAETIVSHIRKHYGQNYRINHLVLSHADSDHAAGLVGVLKNIKVDNLWMNRPWLYAAQVLPHFQGNYSVQGLVERMREMNATLVQLEELALAQGTKVREVFQGSIVGAFRVFAPSRQRYIDAIPDLGRTPTSYRETRAGALFKGLVEAAKAWIDEQWDLETLSNSPESTTASNETAVVQHAIIDGNSILLTSDVGPAGLDEAADFAASLGLLRPPNFVQVPHHGSRRNVTPLVLNRWLGGKMAKDSVYGTAVCSVGSEQPDYPRGQVKNAFQRRGYPVHATRGGTKSYYSGRELRPGWSESVPEPFATRIEL